MGIFSSIQGAVAQGVLWSIMTLGVYITFKVLDFADLTVDGSFATGGGVSAVLISHGMNPFLSLLIALIAGMACGFITGFLHTKLEIPGILAGILTMIALYSINIRIMISGVTAKKSSFPFFAILSISFFNLLYTIFLGEFGENSVYHTNCGFKIPIVCFVETFKLGLERIYEFFTASINVFRSFI